MTHKLPRYRNFFALQKTLNIYSTKTLQNPPKHQISTQEKTLQIPPKDVEYLSNKNAPKSSKNICLAKTPQKFKFQRTNHIKNPQNRGSRATLTENQDILVFF
jgi:hypothetical protein